MGGVTSKFKNPFRKKKKITDEEALREGQKNDTRELESTEDTSKSLNASICDHIDEKSKGDFSRAMRLSGDLSSPTTTHWMINVKDADHDQSENQSDTSSSIRCDPPNTVETHTKLPELPKSRMLVQQNTGRSDEDNRSEYFLHLNHTTKSKDAQEEERASSAPPESLKEPKKRKRIKVVHPASDDRTGQTSQPPPAPTPPPPPRRVFLDSSGNESPRDPRLQLGSIHENDDEIPHAMSKTEWMEKLRRKDTEIDGLQTKLRMLSEDNENLRLRLSAAAGTKLTTNNPNITDLSDGNRPGKLAERFSELYDNEWTDAYAILEELYKDVGLKSGKKVKLVKEITQILLQLLHKIYTTCHNEAKSNMDSLWNAYTNVCGKVSDANLEIRKHIMTERKSNYKATLSAVCGVVTKEILSYVYGHWKLKESPDILSRLQPYTDTCIEVCWLMVIQDPPVYVCCDKVTKKMRILFDKDLYKEYTSSGKQIAFLVWPVLYLYEGGPILNKGVAQGTGNKHSNRSYQSTGIGSVQNDKVVDEIKTLSE